MANIDTPIWAIEGVALESVDPAVAGSLGHRVLAIQNALGGEDNSHLPLFTGDVYYVDAAQSDDSGDGTSPGTAKKTIGAGIGLLSAGDALTVKAGTYTEVGLDLNVNACELWLEHGTIIAPASGTALTISGNYCMVQSPNGSAFLTVPAGETGLLVSGANCYIHDVRSSCSSSGNIGFDITGNGSVLTNCRCAGPLTAAFKVQGDKVKLEKCGTGGEVGDSSIGYWVTNSCDKPWLLNCSSRGHETAGYQVDAGCTNGIIKDCASGGGDGRWSDADHAFVWSGFTYDSEKTYDQTMNGGTTYNLFQVTGAVRIFDLYGVVETQIENTASSLHVEAYSTGGSADLTQAPGTNIQAAVAGSLLIKNEDATNDIALVSAATPAVEESSNWRSPQVPAVIVADADQTTYIRVVLSVALSTGVIHWHLHWEPLSDNGFVEAV